jgi:polyphosphate kinase 2 (PPK2 family)
VIPANFKWCARVKVAKTVVDALTARVKELK